MASGTLAVVGLGLDIYAGEQAKDAADAQAENTRLAAEAQVDRINAELDDALSTQAVLFGGQGRVDEGSTKAVVEGDKAAAARDIKATRAGAARTSSAYRSAGRAARFSAIAGGALKAGSSIYKSSQTGGKSSSSTNAYLESMQGKS